MDQNLREAMRIGAAASALDLGFQLALERLARLSEDPGKVVDDMERELVEANRKATPTPNLPDDVYLSLVETGIASVKASCTRVRRALGLGEEPNALR